MKHAKIMSYVFFVICLVYIFMFWDPIKEGLDTIQNQGVAGNAAQFGALIKERVIRSQDTLLVNKYKVDYVDVVNNTRDLVDSLILESLLELDPDKPMPALEKIVTLNNSKLALKSIVL